MKNTTAARILFWCLLPFALLDLFVLGAVMMMQPQGGNELPTPGALAFGLFYMIGGLVIWLALFWIADGLEAMEGNRRIWGSHLVFNAAATLFWLITAGITQSAAALMPLAVVLPVLAVATNFYQKNFQYQPTTNPKII